MISKEAQQKIDKWIEKYPSEQKQSAVMESLKIVQEENKGFLDEKQIKSVAKYLEMPEVKVQEVATFYENYNHKKVGKFQIRFCHNISCMLNGADDLISYLENKLDIKVGDVTRDGRFSLKKVECLGSCVGAPMMQIGGTYYENLTTDKLDEILDNL
ncbi:NADH-ubiquinone oxidoreductase chain E [hydrothermal vent metagenome]|uniref:NADH-ubiquinone oxidoreductase chain E n=1 Tax=hydrothermal vent metagenome TaxID=652676 RepID=A0A1W1CC08_9ZZZZ